MPCFSGNPELSGHPRCVKTLHLIETNILIPDTALYLYGYGHAHQKCPIFAKKCQKLHVLGHFSGNPEQSGIPKCVKKLRPTETNILVPYMVLYLYL